MKIICKWTFKGDMGNPKSKQRNVDNMPAEELYDMLITLLAQQETINVSFEKENN